MHRISAAVALTLTLAFMSIFGAATAAADPVGCTLDSVTAITGMDPRNDENVDGVRVAVAGVLPADIGRSVTDIVTGLMIVSEPIRTTVEPIADGAVVTVRGVTGELPPELESALETATGCLVGDGTERAIDPGQLGTADPAGTECAVTRVLPVDATGEVTGVVSEIEGLLIGVTGPLPVELEPTVLAVLDQVGVVLSDAVVEVVEVVDGVQVQLEGVAGPLPIDLSSELASALGCTEAESAQPAPTDGGGDSSDGETDGGLEVHGGDQAAAAAGEGDTDADAERAGLTALSTTGGENVLGAAGLLLAAATIAVRRFVLGD